MQLHISSFLLYASAGKLRFIQNFSSIRSLANSLTTSFTSSAAVAVKKSPTINETFSEYAATKPWFQVCIHTHIVKLITIRNSGPLKVKYIFISKTFI